MSIVQWDETLSVGVREIDAQHQGLLCLINELHESMKQGKSREMLGQVVARLKDYARAHFSTEEKHLRQTAFPGFEEHRIQHDKFIEKVLDFELEMAEGRTSPLEVARFLMDWYVRHVKGLDRQYAGHLQSHGVR
jgi:hemerythrin